MKKLLLLLFTLISPIFAMEQPKDQIKIEQIAEITYSDPQFDENAAHYIIKAEKNSNKVGSATFHYSPFDKNLGHIFELEVDTEYREQGIGYQLFKQTILELKKQGYQKITWLAWSSDEENMPCTLLKDIYTHMGKKLSTEVTCDLIIEPWERDPQEIYCTLTLS